jgi:hypothetical protein
LAHVFFLALRKLKAAQQNAQTRATAWQARALLFAS